MSRLKTIVQTGLGVGLAGFLATSTLADDKPDCIDPQTQMEMTFCAGVDYQEADAALNALWPDVLAAARLNDEYVGDMARERGVPTTVEALRDAQRAWIKFRDAQCEYEAYEVFGGTACSRWLEACVLRD
jgi:uncharacterized protein YecT (DUF1311 family)